MAGILNAIYWDVDFTQTFDSNGYYEELKKQYGVVQTVPVPGAAAGKHNKRYCTVLFSKDMQGFY
jgi:hypothetical protein